MSDPDGTPASSTADPGNASEPIIVEEDGASSTPKRLGKPQSAKDDSEEINPLTEFVTTSYVIDSINLALENVMKQEGINSQSSSPQPASASGEKQSFFELQKRMPDGSTRKATDEEMSSQDMKNKLEQAAQLTSKMTLEEKLEWAQKQRQEGNALYQEKKYKQAIDIYLTCLVVRDMEKEKVDDQQVLLLPVMNNLAQCALQLGWNHKAEVFATLALEALDETTGGTPVAKLYFKRAKARRLRGWYDEAAADLNRAMTKLGVTGDEDVKSPEHKAIEQELQLLVKAVAEGKKNQKRAQRAMQKVLGSSEPSNMTPKEEEKVSIKTGAAAQPKQKPDSTTNKDNRDDTVPLYHEKHGRTHSTIRKRPEGPPPYERPRLSTELSYWQMYRLILARVAQRLLDIIGEDEGSGFGGTNPPQPGQTGRPKQE